jgi:hypothetical protein
MCSVPDRCVICLQDITDDITQIPCSHIFHGTCLKPWQEQTNSCPTCRKPVDPMENIRPLPPDTSEDSEFASALAIQEYNVLDVYISDNFWLQLSGQIRDNTQYRIISDSGHFWINDETQEDETQEDETQEDETQIDNQYWLSRTLAIVEDELHEDELHEDEKQIEMESCQCGFCLRILSDVEFIVCDNCINMKYCNRECMTSHQSEHTSFCGE